MQQLIVVVIVYVCFVYIFVPVSWSQNATLVVLVLVLLVLGIGSLKIPEAFLIRSAAQRNFAHTFALTFSTDLPYQILKLIFN